MADETQPAVQPVPEDNPRESAVPAEQEVVFESPVVKDEREAEEAKAEEPKDEEHESLSQRVQDAEAKVEEEEKKLVEDAIEFKHELDVSILHEHSLTVDRVRETPTGPVGHQEQFVGVRS